MSQSEMAEIVGISYQALQAYRKDGCPCRQGDGRQLIFNTADTIEWLRDRARKSAEAPEAAEERARLLRAQAEKAEIEVAKLRGEIVDIADVEKRWGEMAASFKAKMIEIIPRAANMCGLRQEQAVALQKQLIYRALEELANGKSTRSQRKKNPHAAVASS